jgi:hypothetical protein
LLKKYYYKIAMKDRMDETTQVAYREETKKVMKADSMLDRFFSTSIAKKTRQFAVSP